MTGFFSDQTVNKRKPLSLLPECGACGLYKTCKSPKMAVQGEGKKKILIVGAFPNGEADLRRTPTDSESFRKLQILLSRLDCDIQRECWFTNAFICGPGNRDAKTYNKAVEYCRPNLIKTIREKNPVVIILLGAFAAKSLIPHLSGNGIGDFERWPGWRIPDRTLNAWVCPTWSLHDLEKNKNHPVMTMLWEKHITEAVKLADKRPHNLLDLAFGSIKNKVQVITTEGAIKFVLNRFVVRNKPIAFDYETNMLKPDSDKAEIICCSISDGNNTFAFPWNREAKEGMIDVLQSDVPKIGANIKFEERWTMKKLGIRVRNWKMDDVITSHTLDNRPGINNIEFQAYVRLGVPEWSSSIGQYLKSEKRGGQEINRIKECDIKELLIYCGIDSSVEWQLAQVYNKELK